MAADTIIPTDSLLSDFLARHTTLYDSANDAYECAPYDLSVKAGKNTVIYNAHGYHTKVPPQGIEHYINHFTKPRDLIVDPFCGSGMTGIAALRNKRSVILNDLSPAACHIARNYCTPVDVDKFKEAFGQIRDSVAEEFDWLYGTKCDCGQRATIRFTIWSDVLACRCGSEIILWEVGVDHENRNVKETFRCPNPTCKQEWKKGDLPRLRSIPVVTQFSCSHCGRKSHATTASEYALIAEIERQKIPYWYPEEPFDKSREMWRAVHKDHGITDSSKFYTKRNLWALARLWHELEGVKNQNIAQHLRFLITSCFGHLELLTRYKFGKGGNSALNGTLYIGSYTVEDNPLRLLETKILQVGRAFEELESTIPEWQALVVEGSATRLPLPDISVDYIFTDPPFGSNIFYSDLNFLWESWLGRMTNETYEAVVHLKNKKRNKIDDYKRLMSESFNEMHRILKPNRWATVVFSNSDDDVWALIQESAQSAGFIIYGGKEFDKVQRSYKGVKGAKGEEKVATKDVILNLHKPRVPLVRGTDLKKVDDVEGFVLKELRETLLHMPLDAPLEDRTSEALARAVTRRAIGQGYSMKGLSFNYVEDVLVIHKHEFVNIDGGWYFTAAKPDLQRIVDERSAIVWLTTILSKEPKRFDEINLQWQQEIGKTKYRSPEGLKALLDTWFLTSDGRYYPPDEYERKQIKGLVEEDRFREAERFLMGKLDRQPSLEEIFQWIEVYYGRQEWEKVVEITKMLDLQADWQAAAGARTAQMRIQLATSKLSAKKQTTTSEQQDMF